jgi:DDE superfamily endonuclease
MQTVEMRVWHPCGQTAVIPVSPNRDSIHFYAALNLQTGKETVMRSSRMNGATTLLFLLMRFALYPTQPVLPLWDRAPWHRSKLVKTFLLDHPRIEILWLPLPLPHSIRRSMSGKPHEKRLATIILSQSLTRSLTLLKRI